MSTEIGGAAAATHELEIKEKVEVFQEAVGHYDEEIPQLVPMQRRSFAELKKMEQSQEKGDNLCEKTNLSLGKRKKQPLLLESPKSKLKVTGERNSQTCRHHQNRKNPPHLCHQRSCDTSKQIITYATGL